jgi:CheY-like chemotaxis protein
MKRILLVDDDTVILRLYQEGLSQHGAKVDIAADGLAAINTLRTTVPDVIVLDLMMPKLSGVDVLKFIRSEAALKKVPVIVLSNSYMNQLAAEASSLGVQKALLKVRCSPSVLLGVVDEVLAGGAASTDPSLLLAVPDHAPRSAPPSGRPVAPPPGAAQFAAPTLSAVQAIAADFQAKARRSFLQNAPYSCTALRSLCQNFTTASNAAQRDVHLQALCRKVHYIAATAGLAECHHLAQMASAFEALLFELIGRPEAISPSVLRTIASSVDFLALLFDCAFDTRGEVAFSAQALVVDDDQISNRLVVSALQRAQLRAKSTGDPMVGLQWLKETRFDLVLLDIEMPGMNGFELCRRLRSLPGYERTPVIYVTGHDGFVSRAKSVLSGGNDLISKPIFPMDLALKAVALLLKQHLGIA